jgi:DNA-binding GntR family transcriptional regulator
VPSDLYERLRDDLVAGRLGEPPVLGEHALSARYGVSRTPVREALVRLEQDGLVERDGRTARHRTRSAEAINDIYRARTWLERAIASDAAERRTEIDLLRLDRALAAEAAVDPSAATPLELMAANRAFHDALAAAAHNEALLDLQQRLTRHVAQLPATTLSAPGRWPVAHAQHVAIVECVRVGDAASSGRLAEEHLAAARDIRLTQVDLRAGEAP